jgi:hypothetical protein
VASLLVIGTGLLAAGLLLFAVALSARNRMTGR